MNFKFFLKNFSKTIDKWKILGYNGKLSNDGYISLIRRSEWVGELCLSHKKTAEIVILVAIVNIHTPQKSNHRLKIIKE